jgi:hypothetical protein
VYKVFHCHSSSDVVLSTPVARNLYVCGRRNFPDTQGSIFMPDRHRFLVHYGQEKARLSRDQTIRFKLYEGDCKVDFVLSGLTFNASRYYLAKLNNVFVDRIAYTTVWSAFSNECLDEWKNIAYLVSPISTAFFLPDGSLMHRLQAFAALM